VSEREKERVIVGGRGIENQSALVEDSCIRERERERERER